MPDLDLINHISFSLFDMKGSEDAEDEIAQVAKEAVELALFDIEDFLSVDQARKEVTEKIEAVCEKYEKFGATDSEADRAIDEILDIFFE